MKNGVKTAFRVSAALFLVLAFTGSFAAPQTAPAAGPDTSALTSHLRWRSIGPANMVGRISDFEALDSDFTQVLIGSASGGVFKSVNAGTTWEPIFDRYGSASIGDVAFFQKDPSIIWVGTGEECVRNSVAWGDGIYKSTNGGKTFTRMGLETTQTIARVITHPTDQAVVYVAASGHPWGYTGQRGLFKTSDGGLSWVKLTGGLPDDGKTGAIDLVMDPSDPNTLFVAFWQRLRQPWRFDSGGPNSGIYKTTDAGRTWTKLTQGLPAGELGRIGLAISRSNPKVLMAIVEAPFQPRPTVGQGNDQKPNPEYEDMTKLGTGIYRSEDSGATWTFQSRQNNRPFYYSHIYINPLEDKWVYWLATNMSFSPDGGKTWSQVGGLHPDFHAMWIDPDEQEPLLRRPGRGRLPHLRSRPHLGLLRQFHRRPVLRRQRRHARSVLRLRRPSGQRHVGRPVDAPRRPDPDRLLVQHRRRRRLPHPERPAGLADRSTSKARAGRSSASTSRPASPSRSGRPP